MITIQKFFPMKFFGGVGHDPKNNWWDFGGDTNHDPDPGHLDPAIFSKDSLFTIVMPINSQEYNATIVGGGLNSLSAFQLLLLGRPQR